MSQYITDLLNTNMANVKILKISRIERKQRKTLEDVFATIPAQYNPIVLELVSHWIVYQSLTTNETVTIEGKQYSKVQIITDMKQIISTLPFELKFNLGNEGNKGPDTISTIGMRVFEAISMGVQTQVANAFLAEMQVAADAANTFGNTELSNHISKIWLSFSRYYTASYSSLKAVALWGAKKVSDSQLNPVVNFVTNKICRNLIAKRTGGSYVIQAVDKEMLQLLSYIYHEKILEATKDSIKDLFAKREFGNIIEKKDITLDVNKTTSFADDTEELVLTEVEAPVTTTTTQVAQTQPKPTVPPRPNSPQTLVNNANKPKSNR